jgi:hypothetical protein
MIGGWQPHTQAGGAKHTVGFITLLDRLRYKQYFITDLKKIVDTYPQLRPHATRVRQAL